MKRPLPLLAAASLLFLAGGGLFWMTRRTPGAPPQEESSALFKAEAAGAGRLLELQPPPVPLRTVRWAGPLPGQAAVAQVLTQTGRQQAVLFVEGQPIASTTFEPPPGLPSAFFSFAELVDAAVVPGQTAVLLYRGTGTADPGLVLVWDLVSGGIRATFRVPGTRLALTPDRRSVFLFGGRAGVTLLSLAAPGGKGAAPTQVDLPPEVGTISSLLPIGPRTFHVAHTGGLSTWHDGIWSHQPLPPPSPLGFPAGEAALAGGAKGSWWQPEPGQLRPLGENGQAGPPADLRPLLPEAAALDAAMLHLLGMDAEGNLWFGLARPTLPLPAAPPPAETATAEGSPAPMPLDTTARAAWETHLQKGLDRVYRWKPGAGSMTPVAWSALWKAVVPPPGIPLPTGDAGLRPEAGGLFLGAPDRMWWLPLRALQPR